MKALLTIALGSLLLTSCQQCEDLEPALDCLEGTVLGTDCGVPAGAGYFVQINRAIPEPEAALTPPLVPLNTLSAR